MPSPDLPIIQAVQKYAGNLNKHFIGGKFVSGVGRDNIVSVNPSNGAPFAEIQAGSFKDIDTAVQNAHECFENVWSKITPHEREKTIRKISAILEEKMDFISALDALDAGLVYSTLRTMGKAMLIEAVDYYSGWPTKFAGQSFAPAPRPQTPGRTTSLSTIYNPIGVVGCIVPWNAPSTFAIIKAIPALAAGCTVVLKPAEKSPISALYLAELFREAGLPEGAFNVVNGYGEEAGAALVNHPLVRKISFTGSTAVGKAIAASAAKTLKHVTLELGGKSPFIVLKDADLDTAAMTACMSGYFLSGQFCMCPSKLYVEESIQDAFFEKMTYIASTLEVGDSFAESTMMGPVITKNDRDRVAGIVAEAKKNGAEIIYGGNIIAGEGHYYEPTLVTSRDTGSALAQEEIFGPIMLSIPFNQDKIDDLIQSANNVRYGLAASVWTNNLSLGHRIASHLQAGIVGINDHATIDPMVPFGGVKDSGIGREFGEAGYKSFLEMKTLSVCY